MLSPIACIYNFMSAPVHRSAHYRPSPLYCLASLDLLRTEGSLRAWLLPSFLCRPICADIGALTQSHFSAVLALAIRRSAARLVPFYSLSILTHLRHAYPSTVVWLDRRAVFDRRTQTNPSQIPQNAELRHHILTRRQPTRQRFRNTVSSCAPKATAAATTHAYLQPIQG